MSSTTLLNVALHDMKWLQRLAALLTADADEADDLVQDTLVVAWTAPPRDLASPVRPWLATVLRNRFRMLRRSDARRYQRERDGASASASAAEPDHELARVEVLQILVAELGRLAPEDQKVVVRRYFHGEAAADIGRALELPAATVRSRLHRSLQRLRGALDDRFGARERWSMAVLAAPSLPAATPASFTKGNGMSITAKLILVSTVGAIGVAGWLGASEPTPRSPAPAPAVAPPSAATPIAETPRSAWEQRRGAIRRASTPPPTPTPSAPRAGEDDGLRGLMSACLADLASGQSGAVTLSTTKIGAPDIGTIYDDITLVETTFPDEEVLECLIESMHAWVGEAPAESFERSYTTTFVLGQPGPDLAELRRFEFILGAHIGEVRFCERRGDAGAPEIRGEVSVAFEIAEDGRGHARASTSIVGSTDLPQAVLDCILTASQRWSFPTAMHGHRREYHYTLPIPAGKPPEADKPGE